jgi:hypothetical protein
MGKRYLGTFIHPGAAGIFHCLGCAAGIPASEWNSRSAPLDALCLCGVFLKTAYDCFFGSAVLFQPAERIWRNWAPPKCKFFMWLASLNRCWTADRLARRGLDHPEKYLLCDQKEETIFYTLLQCVFAREVWHHILSFIGLQQFSPGRDAAHFQGWSSSEMAVPKLQRKGFNSVVLLVAWRLWRHRKTCVFYGTSPSISRNIEDIKDDAKLWGLAGAAGFQAFFFLNTQEVCVFLY